MSINHINSQFFMMLNRQSATPETYILDASEAEVISLGADGRPVMSNGFTTGTRTIAVSDSGVTAFYAAPAGAATSTSETIDATVGTVTINGSLTVPDITGVSANSINSGIAVFPVGSVTPLIRVGKSRNNSGGNTFIVSKNGVTVGTISGSGSTESVSIVLDSSSGTYQCFAGGAEITLSDDTYTPQALVGAIIITFTIADPTGHVGKSASATFTYP